MSSIQNLTKSQKKRQKRAEKRKASGSPGTIEGGHCTPEHTSAEVAMLLKHLHDSHYLNYADVHIIGHSLGAQTAGHVGHAIPHIGRITGNISMVFNW